MRTEPVFIILKPPVHLSVISEMEERITGDWLVVVSTKDEQCHLRKVCNGTLVTPAELVTMANTWGTLKKFTSVIYLPKVPSLRSKTYKALRKATYHNDLYLSLSTNTIVSDRALEMQNLSNNHKFGFGYVISGSITIDERLTRSTLEVVTDCAKAEIAKIDHFSQFRV